MEQGEMWTRADLEDPAVQRMMKVLRQCYRPVHSLEHTPQNHVHYKTWGVKLKLYVPLLH
jgi:hypothetical protein